MEQYITDPLRLVFVSLFSLLVHSAPIFASYSNHTEPLLFTCPVLIHSLGLKLTTSPLDTRYTCRLSFNFGFSMTPLLIS